MIANRVVRCISLALCAAMAQEPAPIRVNVQLVNVSFTVRDAAGTLITNLTADDLEVFEDGVPQKIAFFGRSIDVPLVLATVVDVSGSQDKFIRQHTRDLEWFLKQVLAAGDRAFLVAFGNNLRLLHDPSGAATDIIRSLEDYQKDRREFPRLGPREHRISGSAVYDAMYHSTEKLASIEGGRKAILILSDGEDNSSAYHMLDAIEAAQNANAVVYAVRYTDLDDGKWNARNKYGVRVFDRIAKETGGGHFDARDKELRVHLKQIGEELRSAYELAYHSTNAASDGAFRKLLVRAKRADLVVRTKSGYYAR